jgi:type I restriction enzyme M protein
MSPKGGIKPHSKFSIPSNRSEVLFVDYIVNHLRPSGRAGIIVPEGIIFQSGNAYKALRKNLVDDGLYAVVSLPSGVFAPYSGVKTSVLLFNNELAKLSKEILFVKVENDGFDLGATKRPINKNDLPQTLHELRAYQNYLESGKVLTPFIERIKKDNNPVTQVIHHNKFILVKKTHIADSGDYNLSADRYKPSNFLVNNKWPMVEFDDVISTITPPAKILKEHFKQEGDFPIIDQSQYEIAGWTNDEATLVKSKKPLVVFGDHTCSVKYIDKAFAQGADGIKILLTNDQLIPKFFYYILKTKPVESEGYQRHFSKLKRYKIPLPPLEIQEQVVKELDGYSAIISGAKKIITNWKPILEDFGVVDFVKVGDVVEFISGVTLAIGDCEDKNGVPIITIADVSEEGNLKLDKLRKVKTTKKVNFLQNGDLLFNWRNGSKNLVGKTARFELDGKYIFASFLLGIRPNKMKVMSKYLWFMLNKYRAEGKYMDFMRQNVNGLFNREELKEVKIPLPPIEIQEQIVEKVEAERELVESTRQLIKIYEDKTKSALEKLYGHDN